MITIHSFDTFIVVFSPPGQGLPFQSTVAILHCCSSSWLCGSVPMSMYLYFIFYPNTMPQTLSLCPLKFQWRSLRCVMGWWQHFCIFALELSSTSLICISLFTTGVLLTTGPHCRRTRSQAWKYHSDPASTSQTQIPKSFSCFFYLFPASSSAQSQIICVQIGCNLFFPTLSFQYLCSDETDMTGEEIASMRDQLHQMLVSNVRAEMRPIMSVADQIDRGMSYEYVSGCPPPPPHWFVNLLQ